MSDSLTFWEEQIFSAEKSKKEITENVKNILELYNLLSLEEKVEVKRLIREQKLF